MYAGPVDACAPIGLVSGSDEVFQHDLYVPDLSGMERREAYVTGEGGGGGGGSGGRVGE